MNPKIRTGAAIGSESQRRFFGKSWRYFALNLSASDTASLTDVSLRSINAIYIKLRERIAVGFEHDPWLGQVEVKSSALTLAVFAASADGARGARPSCLALYKRNGWVFAEIVPDVKKATLQKVIQGKVAPDSVIHSDGYHRL